MLAATAQLALILALLCALLQGLLPLLGTAARDPLLQRLARPAARAHALLLAIALGLLIAAFVSHDFSLQSVAAHSSLNLPLAQRIAAAWAGQEGSLLLWLLSLALWGALAAGWRHTPGPFQAHSLAALGLLSAPLLAFLLFACNPFSSPPGLAADGAGLNPLLRDPAMRFHPPLLYLGQTGFVLLGAQALAAADADWALRVRPWALAAWSCQSLGILAGAFWADHLAGWGWWSWDAVENTSLLPWLCCTALLHLLPLAGQRGRHLKTAQLLALGCSALVLLGIFLTRSGALVSVHAFTGSAFTARPALLMMGLLLAVPGLVWLWLACTRPQRRALPLRRRDFFSLAGVALLLLATLAVLAGTLLPILSPFAVDAGYFPRVLAPIAALLALLMLLTHALPARAGGSPRGRWAMRVAHLGAAIFLGSALCSSLAGSEREAWLMVGEQVEFAGMTLTLERVQGVRETGHLALRATLSLRRGGEELARLQPERRVYPPSPQAFSQMAIFRQASGEIRVSLSETESPELWQLSLQQRPLHAGIWAGGLLLAAGGLLAALTAQRRAAALAAAPVAAPHDPACRARHRRLAAFLLPWSAALLVLLWLLLKGLPFG